MTITASITALPAAPDSTKPTLFEITSDQWCQALPTFGDQLNTLIAQLNNELASLNAAQGLSSKYTFDTTTTDADPGAGKLRLNNLTQNAATVIRLDEEDADLNALSAWISAWDDSTNATKGYIRLMRIGDPTSFIIFKLTALAHPTGYFNLSVTMVAASNPSPFSNADNLVVNFLPVGDQGASVWSGGAISAGAYTNPVTVSAVTNTYTVNAAASNCFYLGALTANSTLAISNPSDGQTINIRIPENATGGFTLTLPSGASVAGALDTGANKVNWLTLTYYGPGTRWEGAYSTLPA